MRSTGDLQCGTLRFYQPDGQGKAKTDVFLRRLFIADLSEPGHSDIYVIFAHPLAFIADQYLKSAIGRPDTIQIPCRLSRGKPDGVVYQVCKNLLKPELIDVDLHIFLFDQF